MLASAGRQGTRGLLFSGRMLNLLARILLLEGRGNEARGLADSDLAANRKAGAPEKARSAREEREMFLGGRLTD